MMIFRDQLQRSIENALTCGFNFRDHGAHTSDLQAPTFGSWRASRAHLGIDGSAHSRALAHMPLTCRRPLARTYAHDLAQDRRPSRRGYVVPRWARWGTNTKTVRVLDQGRV